MRVMCEAGSLEMLGGPEQVHVGTIYLFSEQGTQGNEELWLGLVTGLVNQLSGVVASNLRDVSVGYRRPLRWHKGWISSWAFLISGVVGLHIRENETSGLFSVMLSHDQFVKDTYWKVFD